MNKKRITALMLTLLLSTSTVSAFATQIKSNNKTSVKTSLLKHNNNMVYTGGSNYFDEKTGKYIMKKKTSINKENILIKNNTDTNIDYKDVTNKISNDSELSEWISINRNTKGVYFKNYNNKNYLLISAGKCNTGGYSINLNKLYTKKNILYVDADIKVPSKDSIVTEAITYPYLIIQLDSNSKFNNIVWNQININDLKLNDSTTLGDIKKMFNSANNTGKKLSVIKKVLNFLQTLISL
ncbi:hypothetical protein CLTEP_19100 [Clostridium tepidiprofundi DSM 19306]|uniref:PrcB C-terminal domain-containing protein n=1 Tax=Clostridium tepidiprofundi DSM 19306 TaxID=1121338 RepID=A0A151B2X7_9CLOT|nr:protease complex subunit PrcB family protein [Clostridium tepidiprofundi]KYH34133.1 hypothetical protein CLTEP_19100 [Clostridium tepidiprofundi DSM 19306]